MTRSFQRWTRAERAVLRLLWPIADVRVISQLLSRNVNSLRCQSGLMKLGRKRKYHAWSELEDETIRQLYPRLGSAAARLLGRSESSVYARAHVLGVRRDFGAGVQA